MAKEKETTIIEKINDFALEEIMGERFGRYAKYIIQDRALPDVRDGLKPVQRRILYSMYKDKNTYDKETRKSAKTVGNVIGNYHPHGDTSVYDAMVRLSQKWKQRVILVDMQGNNGSIDGDGPAAMRYTEARLAKISNILLEDIEKDSVEMALTFDDYSYEPTVLPAYFPNLLVNGSTGISAGYATNIPPHNLGEVIDATIKRIDSPNCRLDTIMDIVKGPDFPTGGIVEGKDALIKAYTTGKGKVVVKARYSFESVKGKDQIVITEIPYDTLKCNIIRKIEEIRLDKKIDGIVEVRDESDKNDELRIVIDLKKDANKDLIINYLLKNTDLQTNYAFNMVAIVNRTPKTLGILEMLDAFIVHNKEVVTKRTKFDLDVDLKKIHIIEGFIKALDILDEVIKTIRKSKNKSDAIENLMHEYEFTKAQAEAIVMMQLYKLTNTDVTELKNEFDALTKEIAYFREILASEEKLMGVIKDKLRSIKKEFADPRRTTIKDEVSEIKIDTLDMISKEDFIVCISNNGYVKKVSLKSYNMTNNEYPGVRENDYIEGFYKINNIDTVLLFTNLGNYLFLPVREIQEAKYKDIGTHISNYIKVSDGEKVVKSIGVAKFDDTIITAFTKLGMVKRMVLKDFEVSRYTKPITMFKLKDNDELISINKNNGEETLVITKEGNALKYNTSEIPIVGLRTSGVKSINLSGKDEVISAFVVSTSKEYVTLFTDRNTAKRVKIDEIPKTTRAKKGSSIIKSPKSKTYNLFKGFNTNSKTIFGILDGDIGYMKSSDINIMDKQSVGSTITKKNIEDIFVVTKLKEIKLNNEEIKDVAEEKQEIKEETKTPEVKKEKKETKSQLTMSDFFEEFKI
ncbi:DNA topoisomerase IV subunit A [Holdemanella sp. SCCA2]|nr:DNA topoisomerase IV subunit A [Holdemanella sp. SCCA2]